MRTVFGIVFLIGVGIGIWFYQNKEVVVVKKTVIEDVGKNKMRAPAKVKREVGQWAMVKKEEPKDRRCIENKSFVDCTQSEYEAETTKMADTKLKKKEQAIEREMAKLYKPNEYLDYETKFIQPHTVIDADDVGWGIEDAKYNPKNEILDSYAIKMDTAKLLNNIQNGNVQMVQIDSPRTGETFTYSFKDGAIRNLTSISETSFSVMFSNKYGSKYYLQFLPDSEVSGYFTDRGLRHNIKIKNNTGYIFNY
jgi:hypothetical protein